jgi:hypothetical protein
MTTEDDHCHKRHPSGSRCILRRGHTSHHVAYVRLGPQTTELLAWPKSGQRPVYINGKYVKKDKP